MFKRNVFVSFDYENDKRYKFLLQAWNANPLFHFVFEDFSSQEVQSNDITRIKAALTTKIKLATHVLVIVGREANKIHRDAVKIGFVNWQNYEIYQGRLYQKKIVAVKLDRLYTSPIQLMNVGAHWAHSFTQDSIIHALNAA